MKRKYVICLAPVWLVLYMCSCTTHPKSVLILSSKGQKPVAGATGFFVVYKNEEYFLTNWHVLTGREIDGKYKNETPDMFNVVTKLDDKTDGVTQIQVADHSWLEYRYNKDSLFDIVALKIGAPPIPGITNKFQIDNLSDPSGDKDPCVLYGFPNDYLVTNNKDRYDISEKISTSTVSNDTTARIQWIRFGKAVKWKESMGNGISGSPIFSSSGRLIGIYSTKVTVMPIHSVNYGFFWNISAIKQLLDEGTPVNWFLIH